VVRADSNRESAGGEPLAILETSPPHRPLLDAGIVEREKCGSFAYFSVADGALERVCALLGYD
jgi:hypothetical protein